ncbi:MAG: amidase family protein, partial [Luteococcus japonicus]
MTRIHELSALDLAGAIRGGEVSALEVTVDALERSEGLGPTIGAFIHLAHQQALTSAAALDAHPRTAQGSPLRGVPCPIKGLTMVQGMPWAVGSRVFAGQTATLDDGVTQLLRGAGTVMTGLTTVPEFGLPCYT